MKKKVKDCTIKELNDSEYHFICYPDPYSTYIAVSKDGKKYYDYEEEIEIMELK